MLALRKSDVDLHARTLRVGRSHGSDTTKGGHEDLLPIPDGLLPWVQSALRSSPTDVLFPRADGLQHAPDVQLQDVLRRALARAGPVDGWDHRCRRKGCGHAERRAYAEPGRCPNCGMRLRPVAEPRKLRFHDLRHSTATLLLKAGVPLATVQRILRHTDPKITAEVYGHLDLGDMRAGLNRLELGIPPPDRARFAASLLLGGRTPESEGPGASAFARNSGAFRWSGRLDLNQRPLAPQASALPGCATPR